MGNYTVGVRLDKFQVKGLRPHDLTWNACPLTTPSDNFNKFYFSLVHSECGDITSQLGYRIEKKIKFQIPLFPYYCCPLEYGTT